MISEPGRWPGEPDAKKCVNCHGYVWDEPVVFVSRAVEAVAAKKAISLVGITKARTEKLRAYKAKLLAELEIIGMKEAALL